MRASYHIHDKPLARWTAPAVARLLGAEFKPRFERSSLHLVGKTVGPLEVRVPWQPPTGWALAAGIRVAGDADASASDQQTVIC